MSTRPLTVAQLLPELNAGGVERGAVQIAAALVRAGHRAIVVSAPGPLVAELEASGAEHVALPIGEKRLASLALVRPLRRLFVDGRVDVVHARSRLPAWLGRFALKSIDGPGPAWITTVHGPYSVNRYSRIMVSGDFVIAISEFIRRYITGAYPDIDAARIEVIPRGVDRAEFPFGHRPARSWMDAWHAAHPNLRDEILLTLPARLTRWKGQLDFIALVGELVRRGHRVHGLVAGAAHSRKDAYARELERAVVEQGLREAITFLGHRDDLREILAISDVAYSLAREPEAFGRTTVEALSLGTPVIGYDHGATSEILHAMFPHGKVPPGDPYAAADLTARFIESPPVVPREHPYTLARMQAATLALYERAVARLPGAPFDPDGPARE